MAIGSTKASYSRIKVGMDEHESVLMLCLTLYQALIALSFRLLIANLNDMFR